RSASPSARARPTSRHATCGTETASSSATTSMASAGSSTSSLLLVTICETGEGMTDWRLAVDIGGTFTDVVLLDATSGRVVVDKTLTTPAAPLEGVRTGVRQLLSKAGVAPSAITAPIVHATTLITNALIE